MLLLKRLEWFEQLGLCHVFQVGPRLGSYLSGPPLPPAVGQSLLDGWCLSPCPVSDITFVPPLGLTFPVPFRVSDKQIISLINLLITDLSSLYVCPIFTSTTISFSFSYQQQFLTGLFGYNTRELLRLRSRLLLLNLIFKC